MAITDLYETDILAWSEQQADRLRQLAADERVADGELDWPNIIKEVESVGRDQLLEVGSLLRRALLHMLKAEAWPTMREAPSWRAEAVGFRSEAALRFSPSMRQRLDVARLYRDARRAMPDTVDGLLPLPVPPTCPVTLDELLAE